MKKSTNKRILALAIESSCDETAISVVEFCEGQVRILSNKVSSQVELHAQFGGVVPNLAAREHVKNLPLVFQKALGDAKISPSQLDLLAVTNGPGLIPALLVGTSAARTLAYLWQKPLLGIHHIEGHIYANFITDTNLPASSADGRITPESTNKNSSSSIQNSKLEIRNSTSPEFPILCLVVSGGHTQLVLMRDHFQYEIIGQTLDDAAGEAFDKVARILDIGYPGGPAVAQQAANFQFPISNFQSNLNDQISNDKSKAKKLAPNKLVFPRPMINKPGYDFSFSGLKTAVLYEVKKLKDKLPVADYQLLIPQICHEFQQAVVDVLLNKTVKAAQKYKPKTILLAGGVSANKELREQLGKAVRESIPDTSYMIPDAALTGDNAAMIGAAAVLRWEKMSDDQKQAAAKGWATTQADANLKLK